MANKIETLPDGKLHVELETGEKFDGDPLEVTAKLAEAQVNTKRWGQEWKVKAETPPTPVVTPPTPEAQNQAQLRAYLLDEHAQALGYKNAEEYKADLAKVKHTAEEVNNNLVASQFMAQCQDFPNSAESIDALSKKIDEMKWDFTPQSMIAAHALCLREEKYKPLSTEEQNAAWSKGLQNSNRPTPPPMIRSQSPDSHQQAANLYTEPMAEQRARIIREQLEGR